MNVAAHRQDDGLNDVQAYSADSIKVLKGLEAVRKRPGMYIGDTDDGSGLHHMVYEVVDNGIDEVLAGHADAVNVILNADGSCSVTDNGRGIPVDTHKGEGVSAAEVIMTQLHAGGKFDQNSYKVSGGLHGVGVSVVNALSEWLELRIWRDGKVHDARFEQGLTARHLEVTGKAPRDEGRGRPLTGTEVTFKPDAAVFSQVLDFDFATLANRLRELAFLNSGARIILTDNRGDEPRAEEFFYEGGARAFVAHLDRNRTPVAACEPLFAAGEDDKRRITVELSLQWTTAHTETLLAFTNNIPQRDGGTHVQGFRAAMTRVMGNYIKANDLLKRGDIEPSGDDIREGLTCVLSVKVPDPKFSSQTKDKLVSSEVRQAVEGIVSDALQTWLDEHPKEAREIVGKALGAARAREAGRKAREASRKQTSRDELAKTPGKLAACRTKNPEEAEIYLVEGDSAGGSAKEGRNSRFQAILPLKGKILNVEKSTLDKMLQSAEVGTIIDSLGTGIGDTFDADRCRYHKIVLMADADVDGSHIRTLLLTLFYKRLPELIERGWLYIAQPPLFKVTKGKKETYLKHEAALDAWLIENGAQAMSLMAMNGGKTEVPSDLTVAALARRAAQDAHRVARLATIIGHPLIADTMAGFGVVHPGYFQGENVAKTMDTLIKLLNHHEGQRIWSWRADSGHAGTTLVFLREHRGVNEEYPLAPDDLALPELRPLVAEARALRQTYGIGLHITAAGEAKSCPGPMAFFDVVKALGSKGVSINRYKGLGEMDADQIWETTMDPEDRTLLQVTIEDAENATEVFETLMGAEVEPRRAFIQAHAADATNLDI